MLFLQGLWAVYYMENNEKAVESLNTLPCQNHWGVKNFLLKENLWKRTLTFPVLMAKAGLLLEVNYSTHCTPCSVLFTIPAVKVLNWGCPRDCLETQGIRKISQNMEERTVGVSPQCLTCGWLPAGFLELGEESHNTSMFYEIFSMRCVE